MHLTFNRPKAYFRNLSFALLLSVTPALCEPMFAVTTTNQLIRFDSTAPSTTLSTTALTGLQTNETILGADFRPANGKLYAVGSTSRLYTIDLATAAATQVGSATFTPALSGNDFAISFNPVVDRIRVVSDADQNFRLNPDTGETAATDTTLVYDASDANTGVDPNLTCIAYTNSFLGATTSTLFGIDSSLDTLVTVGGAAGSPSPNSGTLFTRATLGAPTTPRCSLDVSNLTGRFWGAFASASDSDSKLYKIDYGFSNPLSYRGKIGSGVVVRALSSPIYETNVPVITLTNPNSGTVTTSRSSVTFRGTVSDDTLTTGLKYRTVVNGRKSSYKAVTITGNAFSFRVSSLARGRRTRVEIIATDIWGNSSLNSTVTITRR